MMLLAAALVAGVIVLIAACRPNNAAPRDGDSPALQSAQAVVLSAAASTKEVAEELVRRFELLTGGTVRINLGSSSALAAQIMSGAPVDLYLSASPEWAAAVADAGLVEQQVPLMANTLVLVTPRGNPARVKNPADLTGDAVRHVALAGETVPAGKYAEQALRALGLQNRLLADNRIVRGQDVRVALSYVERGEAEAGIVYATDARASRGVEVVYAFDPADHDPILYVLAILKAARRNPLAAQFGEYLQSAEAQALIDSHGFRSAVQ
jgi:molybdate transport system substrate-binding protein